jgi:hypothetical protein
LVVMYLEPGSGLDTVTFLSLTLAPQRPLDIGGGEQRFPNHRKIGEGRSAGDGRQGSMKPEVGARNTIWPIDSGSSAPKQLAQRHCKRPVERGAPADRTRRTPHLSQQNATQRTAAVRPPARRPLRRVLFGAFQGLRPERRAPGRPGTARWARSAIARGRRALPRCDRL